MKEIIALMGTLIALMTFFWMMTNRNICKIIENAIKNHKEDPNAHYIYTDRNTLNLTYEKLIAKLETMNKELIDLREELHLFKERLSTKFDL